MITASHSTYLSANSPQVSYLKKVPKEVGVPSSGEDSFRSQTRLGRSDTHALREPDISRAIIGIKRRDFTSAFDANVVHWALGRWEHFLKNHHFPKSLAYYFIHQSPQTKGPIGNDGRSFGSLCDSSHISGRNWVRIILGPRAEELSKLLRTRETRVSTFGTKRRELIQSRALIYVQLRLIDFEKQIL